VLRLVSYAYMPSPLPRQVRWSLFARPSPSSAAFPVIKPGRLLQLLFRGLLSVRVERTSSRAGVAPAEVQRLSRRTLSSIDRVGVKPFRGYNRLDGLVRAAFLRSSRKRKGFQCWQSSGSAVFKSSLNVDVWEWGRPQCQPPDLSGIMFPGPLR
jgi:hypothetical protein